MSSDKKPTIGWIGTGVMGLSMCRHLIGAGYQAVVYNRTKEKALPLVEAGAQYAKSPADVASRADIIFTIVGYPADVREVYFGDQGIFSQVKEGAILIDMTTTSPTLAKEIAHRSRELGAAAIDAPVSGGDVGARNGALSIMAGGEQEAFDRVLPLFQLMGKKISLLGEAGAGQHTKMCNQIVISGTMIGVCESLLYARKTGLPLDKLIDIISGGAAGCWTLNNLAPRIVKGDYDPGFFVDHFIKDMGIALEEAAAMQLSLPGLALVHQLYVALQSQGGGSLGTQALIRALDVLNGGDQ